MVGCGSLSFSLFPTHSLGERTVRSYDTAGQVTHIAQITPLSEHLHQIDHYTPQQTYLGTTYHGVPRGSYDRYGRLPAASPDSLSLPGSVSH